MAVEAVAAAASTGGVGFEGEEFESALFFRGEGGATVHRAVKRGVSRHEGQEKLLQGEDGPLHGELRGAKRRRDLVAHGNVPGQDGD